MIKIFQALFSRENYKESLKKCCLENKLPLTIVTSLNLQKASTLYQQILQMYKIEPSKAQTEWLQNELKLFSWVLVSESYLQQKLIENFGQNEWRLIQSYFGAKSVLVLQYEYRKLLLKTDKDSYCLWDQNQKQNLIKIVSQKPEPYCWEDIARSLYHLSGRNSIKTGKQCREHWYNHLDPTKKHGEWQKHQDLQIVRFSLKNGHKWSLLCKNVFAHRTEHMVKNRFNSILRKYKEGQMYSAANQRKILKRIVKKLEDEMAQTAPLTHNQPSLSSLSHHDKPSLNQPTHIKPQTSFARKTPAAHQKPTFPFLDSYPILPLPSSLGPLPNNPGQGGSSGLNYGYNAGMVPNPASMFLPPNFMFNYPMWQHPAYYWLNQKP